MSYFSWYFIDSYLFSPSHPKTRPLHRGHRWCRWSLKKAYKLVSEDRKKTNQLRRALTSTPSVNTSIYQRRRLKRLTVSSREATEALVEFPPSKSSGSVGQFEAPPTICPWIAVPSTVPSTSTIIPESNTGRERQSLKDRRTWESISWPRVCKLTYDKRWQSPSPSGRCWWT